VPSADGDSNSEGAGSGVPTGADEAIASGNGAPAAGSAGLGLGLAVMNEGSSGCAAPSALTSLAGWDWESRYGRKSRGRPSRPCRLSR
jgi:hypothetical protein